METAKRTGRAVALEDLTGIRGRQRVSKKQRSRFSGWAFYQLRKFVTYKAEAAGIPIFLVPPEYTSQHHMSVNILIKETGGRGSEFKCCKCGHTDHAGMNAAGEYQITQLSSISLWPGSPHSSDINDKPPSFEAGGILTERTFLFDLF